MSVTLVRRIRLLILSTYYMLPVCLHLSLAYSLGDIISHCSFVVDLLSPALLCSLFLPFPSLLSLPLRAALAVRYAADFTELRGIPTGMGRNTSERLGDINFNVALYISKT